MITLDPKPEAAVEPVQVEVTEALEEGEDVQLKACK